MKVFSSKFQPKTDLIVILSIILTKIENLSLNFRKFDYFFKFNKNAEYLHLLEDFPKNHFESKTEVQLIHRVLVTYF